MNEEKSEIAKRTKEKMREEERGAKESENEEK